jgi:hypothetical protein
MGGGGGNFPTLNRPGCSASGLPHVIDGPVECCEETPLGTGGDLFPTGCSVYHWPARGTKSRIRKKNVASLEAVQSAAFPVKQPRVLALDTADPSLMRAVTVSGIADGPPPEQGTPCAASETASHVQAVLGSCREQVPLSGGLLLHPKHACSHRTPTSSGSCLVTDAVPFRCRFRK